MKEDQAREILNVSPDASEEVVKQRYQKLSKKNHPDKGGSAELFKLINEAYETLTSEVNKTSVDEREEDVEQLFNTYDPDKISEIQVNKIVQNSISKLVTKNRLLKKTPGITHPQTLTDNPLIAYIAKEEIPHFTLRFSKITEGNHTFAPSNGGFLILTDVRILCIIGKEEGDEEMPIPYQIVTGVDSRGALLSHRHKFVIESKNGQFRFKIDHNSTGESQISGQKDLDREIEKAEQFVREAVYAAME
jgi:hypothetical protein